MKRILTAFLIATGALLSAPAVWAEEVALIISNEYYRQQPRVPNARTIVNLGNNFRQAGFSVIQLNNTESNFSDSDAAKLLQRLKRASRLVVVLNGHIVRSHGAGWLLNTDAGKVNSLTLGRQALPIQAFLAIASGKQGAAVVALAQSGRELALGFGVAAGFTPTGIAQGVTVLTGDSQQISSFIAGEMLVPGRDMAQAIRNAPEGFTALGYLPRTRVFVPRNAVVVDQNALALSAWRDAQAANTISGYETFLRRFPNSQYALQARQRLDDLQLTPQDRARLVEEGLALTRDQRRTIQRNLTLLGFDTYGIDGLFGGRSRTAIANWQTSINIARSGYLNANQISRLEVAAATRAEQLRREAEQRRLTEERRDRQFWQQTGAIGSEAGLHAYLQRYPDGLFSPQASERLAVIEREQRRLAKAAERQAWDAAVMAGSLASYQQYLGEYPRGRFADEARARVQNLSNPETPRHVVENARVEENSLKLNAVMRRLAEAQLKRSNLDPGQVDGQFTNDTRRAIRQYQRANSLPVTGYITKDTAVRLLANAVLR